VFCCGWLACLPRGTSPVRFPCLQAGMRRGPMAPAGVKVRYVSLKQGTLPAVVKHCLRWSNTACSGQTLPAVVKHCQRTHRRSVAAPPYCATDQCRSITAPPSCQIRWAHPCALPQVATTSQRVTSGKSAIHGWGAFAKTHHRAGEMVIEYAGGWVSGRPCEAGGRMFDARAGQGLRARRTSAQYMLALGA